LQKDGEPSYRPEDLTGAVRRLDMALSRWHAEVADRLGMDEAELLVMARLAMDESQGPAELARGLHMTSGAMTAVLDRLAAHGHLERRPHPTDRRRVTLHLTPGAHEVARAEVRPMADTMTEFARRLSPEERAAAGRYLDELVAVVTAAGATPRDSRRPSSSRR
jgi:DNA-binding MarR family transcriptional regulator